MLAYALRRLNLLFVTLLILSLVSFALAYLFPGDALTNLSGINPQSEQQAAQLRQHYAMDSNLVAQYWRYMQLVFAGDWGLSFANQSDLFADLRVTIPATIELSFYALLVALAFGIPLGIVAGLNHHKLPDYGILSVSVLGYSFPVFWLALILILVFALQLGLFPMSGRISLLLEVPQNTGFMLLDILTAEHIDRRLALRDAVAHLVLPTLSIALITGSSVVRVTRRSILNVYEQEYIKAAYGRGLTNRQVFWQHAFRNAMLPILPILAMQFTTLLTNAMIVEVIFSWPGVGDWLIQAIYQRDYPAIRAGMLAVSSLVIAFTISLDILLRALDPIRGVSNYVRL